MIRIRFEYTKGGKQNQIDYSDSIREWGVQNAIGVGGKKTSSRLDVKLNFESLSIENQQLRVLSARILPDHELFTLENRCRFSLLWRATWTS